MKDNARCFRKEFESLVNRYSLENVSDTPDYILVEYIIRALSAFDAVTIMRDKHNSRPLEPEKERWRCLLCGRDKFTAKTPHNCNTGYRKRHIKWERVEPEKKEWCGCLPDRQYKAVDKCGHCGLPIRPAEVEKVEPSLSYIAKGIDTIIAMLED